MITNKRPSYNCGTCQNLKTSPYLVFIFVDDNTSYWTHDEVFYFWQNMVIKATEFIEKQAKRYHYHIKIGKTYYATGYDNKVVRYKGNIITDLMKNNIERDILDQVSQCLGFQSKDAMYQYHKKLSHNAQVGFIIVVNKEGRSYCIHDTHKKNNNLIEYVVQYVRHTGENRGYPSSLAHEILHLFGAEDYYDPTNKYPKRKIIAERLYRNDIMLNVYWNINKNTIDAYTAYSIGWLDLMPIECDIKEWWE